MDANEVYEFFGHNIVMEDCQLIVQLCDGELKIDPHNIPDRFEGTANWVRQCHNYPRERELVMSALNDLIGGFGTEVLRDSDPSTGDEPLAEYVNTGDTYSATIVYEMESGNFVLSTWGDWMEGWENEQHEENCTIQCGWCSHRTPQATQPEEGDKCPLCLKGRVRSDGSFLVCRKCGHDFGTPDDEPDWHETICENCGNFVDGKVGPGNNKSGYPMLGGS